MTYTPTTRLPHQGQQSPGSRRSDILKGIAATIGALLIVVGLPTLLVAFVGNPFAGFVGSGLLAAGLDAQLIINVFVIVLWVAWAYFTVTLIIEFARAIAARRRGGAVLAPGGAGILARRMVASMMLLFGAAALTPSFGGLIGDSAEEKFAAAEYERSSHEAEVVYENMAAIADRQAAQAAAEAGGAEAGEDRLVTYVVQPQDGRHYDTLWDISERYLGDGMRYKEIYELNKDKEQPDGTMLRDADLIYPGWTLKLPGDATGEGLNVFDHSMGTPLLATGGSAAGVSDSGASDSSDAGTSDAGVVEAGAGAAGGAAGGNGAQTASGSADTHLAAAAQHRAAAAQIDTGRADIGRESSTSQGIRHAVGGGLLAAGVLLALSARRGPFGAVPDERMLRLAENTGLAHDLDRALRMLALGCRETGSALPEATAVMASPDTIVLHHASGDQVSPPWPWRKVEDGIAWIVDVAELPDQLPADRSDVPAPYPALVNIAQTAGYEILIDLESAPGLVSIAGDDALGREILMSMAVELATNVWSDGVAVDVVGFDERLSTIAPDRITESRSLSDVLDTVADEEAATQRLLESMGMAGVLAGRAGRLGTGVRPRVVFTSSAPTPEENVRIQRMVGLSRVPLAVVNLGRTAATRWHLSVGADASVSLDVLNLHGQARRITADQLEEITGLFRSAEQAREAATATMADIDPRTAAQQIGAGAATAEGVVDSTGIGAGVAAGAGAGILDGPGPDGSPAGPGALPIPATDPARLRTDLTRRPAVIVSLFGPVRVHAPGPVDPHQAKLLTELVVAVALHPDGLHDAVLRSIVWPRGAGDDVVAAATAAAAAWLGRDESGADRLARGEDGKWTLSADVMSEWTLLAQVAKFGYGTPEEIELFGMLLDRAEGEVMTTPAGPGYTWLAFHSARRDARILLTSIALRGAGESVRAGRIEAAIWFLRQGLILVPAAEPLWRELLRLTHDQDPNSAAEVASSLYRTLSAHGVPKAEAQTDALVAQLAPARETA